MDSLSGSWMLASTLVGTVGFAFFIYGKKQLRIPQLVVGIAMMTYPYFVGSTGLMLAIAAGLVGLLWCSSRLGY